MLTWCVAAAIAPRSPRSWAAVGGLVALSGLAVSSGYSDSVKAAFVIGVVSFLLALVTPRAVRYASVAAFVGLFVLAPLLAGEGWGYATAKSARVQSRVVSRLI